ncbi:YdiU family protein [Armatimonas sp.]|uniref:protein adenylyltransferase SelO n=1 Tax=Armatimonas sp. TaxID=1872638 RepID=UPI0037522230
MSSHSWQFDNTYARLPAAFFEKATPALTPAPQLVLFNKRLAEELGLQLDGELAPLFAGQAIPKGSEPIAQAYAGHQFGGFTMLGDGRAILLGEHVTPAGARVDIQLKGSGRTPYSRRGDGLAALGPMLREYIISEAMHALGIPTTRSLAVVTTGEQIERETRRPGAILTRVAASHIRVGTFQYAAARRDEANLRVLADYTIARHYPELATSSEKYAAFLHAVLARQAALIAQWQLVGFIHGVMNTDNMTLSGETIDYGPCAFLDTYHTGTVFSSIDENGRYAYGNQPAIAHWNLTRFAESLLPLLSATEDEAVAIATEALNTFPDLYEQAWLTGMRHKLGLQTAEPDDPALIASLLTWMEQTEADFTNTFRTITDPTDKNADFAAWHARWQERRSREASSSAEQIALMHSTNPSVIPRNHLVEEALTAAENDNNLGPLHALLEVLTKPYEYSAISSKYHEPAPASACGYKTFCGT